MQHPYGPPMIRCGTWLDHVGLVIRMRADCGLGSYIVSSSLIVANLYKALNEDLMIVAITDSPFPVKATNNYPLKRISESIYEVYC